MTTVRHVSQYCSLCYSFSFSHKMFRPLVRVHDCNHKPYAKTRITMLITALHSGQLPPSSATRRAQFSQNLACQQGTKARPSIGANKHTSQHRVGVSAAVGAPCTNAAADALAAVGDKATIEGSKSQNNTRKMYLDLCVK